MKKIAILITLTALSLSLYFISCSKSDSCNCELSDFEYIKLLENNKFYNFKNFKHINGANFLVPDEKFNNEMINLIISDMKLRNDEFLTVGWFYLLNSDINKIDDNFEITEDKIGGIVLFESNEDKLYASFIKKVNDEFEVYAINKLKTNYISTNDLKVICDLYLDFNNIDIIYIFHQM